MAEIFLMKNSFHSFKPAFESDLEIAKKIKINEIYKVKITKPRNVMFHRKYFALLNLAFANFETENTFDDFRKEIIKRAGFYREITNFKGEKEYVAKSISFAGMDDIEFDDLYSKSLAVIFKFTLKLDMTKENLTNLQEELINFM